MYTGETFPVWKPTSPGKLLIGQVPPALDGCVAIHPYDNFPSVLCTGPFEAYKSECERRKMTPVNGNTFFDVLEQFCAEFSIVSETIGDHVYLQGIKITQPASVATA